MAEEKFISVRELTHPCDKCKLKPSCKRICIFAEMFDKDPYKIMRQEAIEKIEKAIIENVDTIANGYKGLAEAALNALLEEK